MPIARERWLITNISGKPLFLGIPKLSPGSTVDLLYFFTQSDVPLQTAIFDAINREEVIIAKERNGVVVETINSSNAQNLMNHTSDNCGHNIASTLNMPNCPVHASNEEALSSGLIAGNVYRTATGELRIVI
jgi:hypothetical protein